eukprot:COSAG02_NODE_460_length_21907_cov_7.742617_10_plen_77_part_00
MVDSVLMLAQQLGPPWTNADATIARTRNLSLLQRQKVQQPWISWKDAREYYVKHGGTEKVATVAERQDLSLSMSVE